MFDRGMPLWQCATAGRYEIAELLLERGADPNADVYASGTPVMQAHRQGDQRMVALLEEYGGAVDAARSASFRCGISSARVRAGREGRSHSPSTDGVRSASICTAYAGGLEIG